MRKCRDRITNIPIARDWSKASSQDVANCRTEDGAGQPACIELACGNSTRWQPRDASRMADVIVRGT